MNIISEPIKIPNVSNLLKKTTEAIQGKKKCFKIKNNLFKEGGCKLESMLAELCQMHFCARKPGAAGSKAVTV